MNVLYVKLKHLFTCDLPICNRPTCSKQWTQNIKIIQKNTQKLANARIAKIKVAFQKCLSKRKPNKY